MPNRVQVLKEACPDRGQGTPALSYQWCLYIYEKDTPEYGYRFMWRRANDNLMAARGGARLPSKKAQDRLRKIADAEGWGDLDADDFDFGLTIAAKGRKVGES